MALWQTTAAVLSVCGLIACGGAVLETETGDSGTGPLSAGPLTGHPDAAGLVTGAGPYPSGTVAVIDEDRGGKIDLFTYDTGSGFTPFGTLSLPSAALCQSLAFDSSHKLYVGCGATAEQSGQIFVFGNGSLGATAPVRTLSGPSIASFRLGGLAVDSSGDIYAYTTGSLTTPGVPSRVSVWGSASDTETTREFSPSSSVFVTYGIAVDGDKNVYLGTASALVDEFAGGATGSASPIRSLGSNPPGAATFGVALGSDGSLFVAETFNFTAGAPLTAGRISILANDGSLPRHIFGDASGLAVVLGVAVDSTGRAYVLNAPAAGAAASLLVFASDADGYPTPEATLPGVEGMGVAIAP